MGGLLPSFSSRVDSLAFVQEGLARFVGVVPSKQAAISDIIDKTLSTSKR
jgi:hypothetical protein